MSNSEKQQNNIKIEIKEIIEKEKEFYKLSKEEINHYFDTINEIKVLGWESKFIRI